MFNKTIIVGVVMGIAALTGCARDSALDVAHEIETLQGRAAALAAAEAAMDSNAALGFWSDDAVMHLAGSPPIVGRAAVAALYEQVFAQIVEFEANSTQIELAAAGDLAWELGTNRTVVAGGQGGLVDTGKYLAVWRKIDGEWLIVAVAATSDAPYMAPVEP